MRVRKGCLTLCSDALDSPLVAYIFLPFLSRLEIIFDYLSITKSNPNHIPTSWTFDTRDFCHSIRKIQTPTLELICWPRRRLRSVHSKSLWWRHLLLRNSWWTDSLLLSLWTATRLSHEFSLFCEVENDWIKSIWCSVLFDLWIKVVFPKFLFPLSCSGENNFNVRSNPAETIVCFSELP